ncbi:MAG: ABC transporter permease, partial [Firmicutes bacterium]|nr:ABC transporter permease [Bacillota bacterium]
MSVPALTESKRRFVEIAGKWRVALVGYGNVVGAYVFVVLLWGIASIFIPGLHDPFPILQTAAFLGIVAAGQTLVVLAAGIDLSVSMTVSVASVSVSTLLGSYHTGTVIAVVVTLVLCAFVGLINGAGTHFLKVSPMVMSLGTLSILQGAFLLYTGGTVVTGYSHFLAILGGGSWLGIPNPVWIWIVLSAVVTLMIARTRTGISLYALGSNAQAARLSGVRVAWVTVTAYVLCAVFAGIAGLLLFGYAGQGYMDLGDPYQLNSIAAVVLGGT